MEKENTPKYKRCTHFAWGDLRTSPYKCAPPEAKTLGEMCNMAHEIDVADCENCNQFESKYIEFPLTISDIEIKQPKAWNISFDPVRVRLCEDEKTYFGIYLGEFPWMTGASFHETDGKLEIWTTENPCIFIPEQKKVVFGASCWWSKIENLNDISDISDITDETIENQWYMKLLREMTDVHN